MTALFVVAVDVTVDVDECATASVDSAVVHVDGYVDGYVRDTPIS